MVQVRLTKAIVRKIAAVTWLLGPILLYVVFPGALRNSLADLAGGLQYTVPVFFVLALFVLLLDVEVQSKVLRAATKVFLFCLCIFMLLYAIELLSGVSLGNLLRYNTKAVGLACLILAAVAGLGFALTGSIPWALRITTIFSALFGYISYFVLQFRGTTFVVQDIFSADTALLVLSSYRFLFTQEIAESLLVFCSVLIIASKIKAARMDVSLRGIVRIGVLALSLVYFGLLIFSQGFYDRFWLRPNYWNQKISSAENGSLINFFSGIPGSFPWKPDEYSLDTVDDIADKYTSDSVADAQIRPDVILIMGESWADMVPEGYSATNMSVTPFLDSLKASDDAVVGDLVVSSVGGGTSQSEFQAFTGTNAVYGIRQAPFQFNVTSSLPSIIKSFQALGYETTAMHTGEATAWGRDKAFPVLGFDTFLDSTGIAQPGSKKLRYYLSDEAMYQKALSILDASDAPQFIYCITIQTHGGYDYEYYESPISITSPAGEYPQTEQYLGLMHESDQDLKAFISALAARERPTLVMGYGDHLPNVEAAYKEAVFGPINQEAFEGMNVMDYMTFYFLWANYPLPEAVKEPPPYLGLHTLGAYLMEGAELPLTGFQKYLLDNAQRFPVTSVIGYVDSQGGYIPIDIARDSSLFTKQAIMQYNMLYDQNHFPEDFYFLSTPGGDATLAADTEGEDT